MFFVDSHCHLVFSKMIDALDRGVDEKDGVDEKYGVDAIVGRAAEAGVKYILAIGTKPSDIGELKEITDKYPNVFRTVGIHPLETDKYYSTRDEAVGILEGDCRDTKVVGVGEIGLDYHYETESRRQQTELFNLQLELAKRHDLPISVHSREASDDTADILKNHAPLSGVIHCFSGERSFAKKALDLGFYLSFSGVVTYKNAGDLRDSLKYVPSDRILIETDCPFLAPVPFRGKTNEPAFVVFVAEKIAELLRVPVERVAEFSSQNFFDLFVRADFFRKGPKID